jgi:hypothetical protein
MLWGALDWQAGSGNPYSTGQTVSGGTSALPPGVGVRRAILVIDRTAALAGADPAEMHLDWLNFTSGSPDDSWITSDFTTCEAAITTWFSALAPYITSAYKLSFINWYRAGVAVGTPNPVIRSTAVSIPGTGAGTGAPPQVACSITFRTAVRKSWGRTYVPLGNLAASNITGSGLITNAMVDAIAAATNTMVTSQASNDFALVVTSLRLSASLNVEHVEVDNMLDVIRRRRYRAATYKKILP